MARKKKTSLSIVAKKLLTMEHIKCLGFRVLIKTDVGIKCDVVPLTTDSDTQIDFYIIIWRVK